LKVQHVSNDIPLIIRSSKLYLESLVYIPMWRPAVVQAGWELDPVPPHGYINQRLQIVWSSWWWAVCRSKHVGPSINFGIINSITRLHLAGYFYWCKCRIMLSGKTDSSCAAFTCFRTCLKRSCVTACHSSVLRLRPHRSFPLFSPPPPSVLLPGVVSISKKPRPRLRQYPPSRHSSFMTSCARLSVPYKLCCKNTTTI